MTENQEPVHPTQLIIVRRGRESTFRLLEREFGNDPSIRIIWDRRYRERRGSSQAVPEDRRRKDRRASAPTNWPPTNYFIVKLRESSREERGTSSDQ